AEDRHELFLFVREREEAEEPERPRERTAAPDALLLYEHGGVMAAEVQHAELLAEAVELLALGREERERHLSIRGVLGLDREGELIARELKAEGERDPLAGLVGEGAIKDDRAVLPI